jgi:hypothetical protein
VVMIRGLDVWVRKRIHRFPPRCLDPDQEFGRWFICLPEMIPAP